MNDAINKAVENTLIIEIKKKNFDFVERAELIQHLIDVEKKKLGTKKCKGNGEEWIVNIVADKLGISRAQLYRTRSILNANDKTRKLMDSGIISGDKVGKILYNLKDKNKENTIVKKAISEDLTTGEIEREISEENDPSKILEHIAADIRKFHKDVIKMRTKLDKLTGNDKIKLVRLITKAISDMEKIKFIIKD